MSLGSRISSSAAARSSLVFLCALSRAWDDGGFSTCFSAQTVRHFGEGDKFLQLTTSLPKSTLVDISQVSYIASFGLSMLVSAAKYLERHGAKMVLLAPSELVRKTIETSSLNEVIPLVNEESTALEVLR